MTLYLTQQNIVFKNNSESMKISYETFEVSINDVIVMSFNVGFKHILFVRRSICACVVL